MVSDQNNISSLDNKVDGEIPVAQYVRMSTEHQRYSTENQELAIAEYASRHGMRIVRTYADAGKSGLRIDGRKELKQLLSDVQKSDIQYKAILVYDVSRWGRFPDPDEAAMYEQSCKRNGIQVIYWKPYRKYRNEIAHSSQLSSFGIGFFSALMNLNVQLPGIDNKQLLKDHFQEQIDEYKLLLIQLQESCYKFITLLSAEIDILKLINNHQKP